MEKKQLTERKTCVLNDDTPRCKFIELPAELRNRIYRLALLEPDAIKINDSSTPQEPSLLSACRQIRQEAISIYYGENHFELQVADLDPTTAQKWLSGSTLRLKSKHRYKIDNSNNWKNLLRWIKGVLDGEITSIPGRNSKNSIALVFSIAMRLYRERKAWEEATPYLEDLHQLLITQDRRWA